jgi:hypothetical protein
MAKPRTSKKNVEVKEALASTAPVSAVTAAAETAASPVPEVVVTPEKTSRRTAMARGEVRPSAIPANLGSTNLVPMNLDEEIRQLAYLLSERRGFTPGHETEDWLAAESEVRTRYHQHSA